MRSLWIVSLVIAACAAATVRGADEPSPCAQDVAQIIEHLRTDYAGYGDARRLLGDELARLEAEALEKAEALEGAACDEMIRGLLSRFGDGHLRLYSEHSRPPARRDTPRVHEDPSPHFKALSEDTALVRIPSFGLSFKASIDEMMAEHEEDIRAREHLIIDVRSNGGGGDSAYETVIPPLYSGPYTAVGVQIQASPGNADALEGLLDQVPEGQDRLRQTVLDIVQRMRDFGQGLMPGGEVNRYTQSEVWERPRSVAVLVDGRCASTCEQFLLAARQSEKVTIFGERTAGALDFANVRAAELPSGTRTLQFGMSRSARLPEGRIDPDGLAPDVAVPTEELRDVDGAVRFVQEWLERVSEEG